MGEHSPRTRAVRRTCATVAGILAVLAMIAGLASPALAASEATFTDLVPGASATVVGTAGGRLQRPTAGLMGMTIDGVPGAGYCIDIHTGITAGTSGMPEVDWDTSGVTNLSAVEQILGSYHPAGSGPAGYAITGTVAQRAAATQAAIWHFTDGFEMVPAENDPVIAANYDAILRAVTDGVLPGFGEPSVSLAIVPPAETEAPQGEPVGPFVVTTTAASVTLTPSAGTVVTDASGDPLSGPLTDGSEFWLVRDDVGQATVTATADASVRAGRVFFKKGSQRLILATTVTATVSAEAGASWITPPTTEPPTTEPPTTEPPTTEPPTTQPPTTEPPTTTPPSSEVTITNQTLDLPASGVSVTAPARTESLPRTGDEARPLLAAAVLLLAVGTGFGLIARRVQSSRV